VRRRRKDAASRHRARATLAGAEATLYDLLTTRPVHVDVLAERSALEPGLLLAALSSLELQGLAQQLPGKHFALAA
jgi:predicted Rossmann fold nucleotide-binding protein DprA/Smf involved in DNA uptake